MSGYSADKRIYQLHAELCKTLAHASRLEILDMLRQGEKTVTELMSSTGLRQANLSQHLAILRQRGIVTARKEGANVKYRVATPKMIQACDIIRKVLIEQLAEGEELLRKVEEVGEE